MIVTRAIKTFLVACVAALCTLKRKREVVMPRYHIYAVMFGVKRSHINTIFRYLLFILNSRGTALHNN